MFSTNLKYLPCKIARPDEIKCLIQQKKNLDFLVSLFIPFIIPSFFFIFFTFIYQHIIEQISELYSYLQRVWIIRKKRRKFFFSIMFSSLRTWPACVLCTLNQYAQILTTRLLTGALIFNINPIKTQKNEFWKIPLNRNKWHNWAKFIIAMTFNGGAREMMQVNIESCVGKEKHTSIVTLHFHAEPFRR